VKPFDIDRLLDAVIEAVGSRTRRPEVEVELGYGLA